MKAGGRRTVLNEARRKVERALAAEEAADDLADAAQTVLGASTPDTIATGVALDALRAALTRYREMREGRTRGRP